MPPRTQDQDFLYLFPESVETEANGKRSLRWNNPDGPFAQARSLPFNANLLTIQSLHDVLSPEDCARVVALGEAQPLIDGRVELGLNPYRVSHISWIVPEPENHWLFHKLAALFSEANRQYGFELTGFVDGLQYTKYTTTHHFEWHVDIGTDRSSGRKLSMTLQLSRPEEYAGGGLEFVSSKIGEEARQLGTATFFPSYLAHRVTPVESGTRRSLVAWAYGPAFR